MKKTLRRRAEFIHALQQLEPRQLLSYSVSSNSAVVMNTSLGEVAISLDSNSPISSANFLSYVTAGAYNNTVFHRIAVSGQTSLNGNTESYSIVQGGGYTESSGTFTPITTLGGLAKGSTYTSIPLSGALSSAISAGSTITLVNNNDGNTQNVTLASAASAGDSALTVASFTTTDAFPSGSTVESSGSAIGTVAGIVNEASTSGNSNTVGTIAMARTSGTNSATSQFFFNVSDNSSYFDPNVSEGSPGYAVFGNVIRGLGIVYTVDNLSPTTVGNFSNVPETSSGGFVTINTATEEDTMTVTIGPHDAAGDHTVSFRDPSTGAGTNISLSDADATITFTGTGLAAKRSNGNLVVTGTNLELQTIASTDTTAKSNLVFSNPGRNKHIDLGDVNITGSINSITGVGVNLTGDLAVTGSVNKITLLASNAAGFISIDTNSVKNAPATVINIPYLSDISIQSGGSIKELITRSYTVNDGTNRGISTNGDITKLLDYGTLGASVESNGNIGKIQANDTGGDIEASGTIDTVELGQMEGGVIYSGQAYNAKTLGIKTIKIKNVLNNTRVIAAGNIGTISATSLGGSAIVAGYDSSDSAADSFTYGLGANAYIKSISLKTPKTPKTNSFGDSQIQAYELDALHLGRVDTTLGETFSVMGIQAVDLKSLTATTSKGQSLALSNITSAATLQAIITQRKLNLGSFTIDIIPTSDIGVVAPSSS